MRTLQFASIPQIGIGFVAIAGVSYACMCTFMENIGYLAQAEGDSMRVFIIYFITIIYKLFFIFFYFRNIFYL